MRLILSIFLSLIVLASKAQDSQNISLIYHWQNDTLLPSVQHFNTYNETWGFIQNGKEYGVIGSTWGTHIFDLSDPSNIYEAAAIQGAYSDTFVVHRDYHDYQGYLYVVCDEGNSQSKLEILDLSDLPNSVSTVYSEDSLFVRSHNIFIDTATAKLYTCGGDQNPGVRVFSLANPITPIEISSVSLPSTSHDIYVRNDTAYINDGTDGLLIYDFSDNANPKLIGSLTSYPQQGYNHSGWLNDAGSIYVLADETHGKDLKILDVSDLENIQVLDTMTSQIDDPNTIPHNVMINGDYAYVSYYFDGLVIYNIADPLNPYIAGYYDTSTETHANWVYRGCWGTYSLFPSGIVLASDMQNGLYVFDVTSAVGITKSAIEQTNIMIFPNPFTESIVMSTPDFRGASYTISNLNGQLVKAGKLENDMESISLSNIPNGSYLVEIKTHSNSIFTKKIIKSN